MSRIKKTLSNFYMNMVLSNEKKYNTQKCELKYLFFRNKKSNRLLIIFSGFPRQDQKSVYNYVLKFRKVNCNKLYILDDFGFNKRGSYYLGEKNDFFVEDAVQKLIEEKRKLCNINKEDIITAGTSKGGFASLYFSIKYKYGYAFAGSPQIKVGDYLMNVDSKILKVIMGNEDIKNIEYLNELIFNLINKQKKLPRLFLHVGKKEHHYDNHMLPLIKFLEKKGFDYELDLGDYENHNDTGKYFPQYLINKVRKIIK